MKNILYIFTVITIISLSCSRNSEQNADVCLTEPQADSTEAALTVDSSHTAFNGIVHRMKVHAVGQSLQRTFNDSNAVHLAAAHAIGFAPITDLRSTYHLSQPIVEIATCNAYHVDKLTHSMPYLVPRAAQLLHDIGTAFSDTIRARGGKSYKIKVTSLTRTDVTVKKLRRRNRNASPESAHRLGTTFDISYSKFICCDSSYVIHEGDLKNILAEILFRLRNEGRCYVKFERKQGCFHITVR